MDISAVQMVGYQSTREEIWDLYHQVYKLRRLPGTLLCGPEQVCKLMRDVMSSLKNCLWQREGEQPRGHEEPEPTDNCLSQDRASQRMRWDTSAKRELAEAREAHWLVQAAAAALEEKIERLSQSTTRSRADSHVPSQIPSPAHSHPQWGPEASEDQEAELPYLEFDLGPSPELGPDVKCFFQEQASSQREDGRSDSFQESPVEDYERWVKWRGQIIATPTWWQELLGILGVSNIQELAQKMRASFELPQWMSKIHDVKNYYLAPPAPRCIWQRAFLLPPDPMFPCQDIREGQSEKTVAYAQALQYWAEKANQPMPGQPHLLARCILELRRAMEPYIPFSDDAVLDGAASLEGSLEDLTRVTIPRNVPLASTGTSTEEESAEEQAPTEVATEEAAPTGKPLKGPTHLLVTVDDPAEEPTALQVRHEE